MRQAILVSGSREWEDTAVIEDRLSRYKPGSILIVGGAFGCDFIAQEYGERNGFDVHVVRYFRDLQKRGGKVRNSCMLDLLQVHIKYYCEPFFEAFPLPNGTGTQDMIEKVRLYNSDWRSDVKRISTWIYPGT